jgi:negative regulator of sigma E activity
MNESIYHQLREISWRRKLTPEEETQLQGWLAAHPDKQVEWELEQSLTDQLRHLSDAPLSSNFTSQVMQALDSELARQESRGYGTARHWLQWLHKLAPRLAPVSLALVVAVTAFVYYRTNDQQQRVAENVAVAISVSDVPGPQILQDFDAISNLPPATDEDLLAALQ